MDDNDVTTSVYALMIIHSTNHRSKNLINKAKPTKQPLTNPRQVNLPFSLLGTMRWLVLAEAWFKVNERSDETVDLGKLAPEKEQRNSTGQQHCAAEMILGEECLVCVSQHNTEDHGIGKSLHAKHDGINSRARRYQTRKKHQNMKGSIPTKYEGWT